jgi:hypothetical protein
MAMSLGTARPMIFRRSRTATKMNPPRPLGTCQTATVLWTQSSQRTSSEEPISEARMDGSNEQSERRATSGFLRVGEDRLTAQTQSRRKRDND